ncbi:chromosome transmission fidelity protein 1 [Cryptococcus deuterogattii MMRL2647]|nr:chromosome transmission fidelity protein 1 [Cryptococcus deuterogattii MMRL2647]
MTNRLAKSATPSLSTPETFPFPYPKPYDIQLDLMRVVFRAIEDGKIAIVESPTGTGKSLSLLTSTLTWLSQHQARLDTDAEASLREQFAADDPDDPPWVIAHAVKARMNELKVVQQEREERLEKARRKEMRMRREGGLGAFKHGPGGGKRIRMGDEEVGKGKTGEIKEDDFLPEDEQKYNEDGPYLSREVRELMSKFELTKTSRKEEDEDEEDVPKVYYTSRTHTQLRQLTSELLKTSFANYDPMPESPSAEAPSHGVSLVPLGSRKQLCINEKVRALARKGGDERMNEACLDMQKPGKGRCEFLPAKTDEIMMLDARDMILASVKDIEDIVALGKKSCVCPYYATRKAVKQSQIVTLPYNLLLQKNAREALGINLKNQVVVIDEAHNLIDTILSVYSTTLTSVNLANAVSQLQQYLQRFKSRLKSKHSLWIQQVLSLLQGLIRVCDKFIQGAKSQVKGDKPVGMPKTEVIDANTLMGRIGGGSDQVNPIELVAYLKASKLARKISGFSEHVAEQASLKNAKIPRSATARHASITAFHIVESFLLSLVDAKDDGRILLSIDDLNKSEPVVVIKYILLNPSERFKEVIEDARSVVLAGGTMEPITDFLQQLFPSIPKDRLLTLSCSHVIPKENLLTQVVSVGPRKSEFEFKFGNRNDEALLTDLGAVLQAIIGVIPDGIVVFLPSYAFLDKVKAFWMKSGLLQRLGERKQLFYEPQKSGDVETILRDYALAITSCHATSAACQKSRKTGALMFAVVGGKLSEGINFSDNLGRCVIMVGLPFANVGSVELRERMQYVETIPGAGQGASREMYENLCMRAVNQSIGRAIRHSNDYATILLVDKRYANPRIRNKLPKWIGEDVRMPQDFGGVARGVATFFKEKKDRGLHNFIV